MSEHFYKFGLAGFRWLCSAEVLARPLDLFSKVWLRHRKLRAHLRAGQFDAVVDGGANVGEFARIVRQVLPQTNLLCVEPRDVRPRFGNKGFKSWRRLTGTDRIGCD